ncbi:MAG: amino acid kinase family protein, partial [Promethearchaeota archaeon]
MMDINKNKSKLTVMKFGGSCLSDKNSFSQISSIIKKYLNQSKIIIVTSALKGITDKLIEYYLKSSEKENNSIIILDEILLIHTNLINQLFAGNEEYKNKALKFLRESGSELMQLGKVINLLRPSKNLQDIIA